MQQGTSAAFFCIVLAMSLMSSSPGFADGTVDVTYGSTFSGSEGLFFVDSNHAGFDSSNVGVLAVGYFDSSFDVPTESKRLVAEGLDDFLANFNLLSSTNFDDAASPGYYTSVGTFSEQSVGSRPYLMTLEGIGSFGEASSATAIGLFTDSQFSSLPYGGDPIGTPYDLATAISFDTVLLGWHVSASDFSDGNAYASQQLPNLSRVWGGSSYLTGNWLQLDWFGIFYQDEVTNWLYHYHLGWLYPEGSDPDRFWIYLPIFDSWAFTGSSLFPMFWLHSEQRWLFITFNEDQTIVTQSFDANTQVWTAFDTP